MRRALGLGAIAAAMVATVAFAQSWQGQGNNALRGRLDNPGTAFNATVGGRPNLDTAEAGRLVAMGGMRDGGPGAACFSCHGATGAGDGSGAFPRIGGQPAWYLYKQLMDYASGRRPNDVMTPIAKQLRENEMEAVSVYYALLEPSYPADVRLQTDTSLQWGGQLAAVGSMERGIPACVNCHGAQGAGIPPSVPQLAGQYAEYTALQLNLWRQGVRNNDPMGVMSAIAVKMTDEDVAAVARYYERVRPVPSASERAALPPVRATPAGAMPPQPGTGRGSAAGPARQPDRRTP